MKGERGSTGVVGYPGERGDDGREGLPGFRVSEEN
jgi:hypothetical protein